MQVLPDDGLLVTMAWMEVCPPANFTHPGILGFPSSGGVGLKTNL